MSCFMLTLFVLLLLDNTAATQINKIRCHPTLPIAVTAHEDKYLRFYDLTSGAVTHSMVAHGDAVSGIAIDPNGLYLLSSSLYLIILADFLFQCVVLVNAKFCGHLI